MCESGAFAVEHGVGNLQPAPHDMASCKECDWCSMANIIWEQGAGFLCMVEHLKISVKRQP